MRWGRGREREEEWERGNEWRWNTFFLMACSEKPIQCEDIVDFDVGFGEPLHQIRQVEFSLDRRWCERGEDEVGDGSVRGLLSPGGKG